MKEKKKCKFSYNETNKLLETLAKGWGQAPLIWSLAAKIASASKRWRAGRNESLAAEITGRSILFCMKLEGKIHDHNGPCCLKIQIWNKPLFCSLNFLRSVVWNPWVDLTWMSKPWIMEWWMLKSWIMEWMLWGEQAKKKSCSAVKFGMARDEDAWGAKMGAVQENPPAPTQGGLVGHVQYCV